MLRDFSLIAVCLLLTLTAATADSHLWDTFPSNEYEYSLRREYLQQKEDEMMENNFALSEDERIVDHYLQYHKYKHFLETKETGFPPLRPIQEVMNAVKNTDVFRLLKDLPKGGNMHSHENHELSRSTLLDIIWESEDFPNLYILPENHRDSPYMMDFMINPPVLGGWVQVEGHQYYTKERILENINLIGIMSANSSAYPSDSNLRWNDLNKLWSRASAQLINNIKIKTEYLNALYASSLAEGVQYLETRKRFRHDENLYELSTDPQYEDTNGKKYLDTTGEEDIKLTMQATSDFILANPEFIGHNRIAYSTRFSSKGEIQDDIANTLMLYDQFPEHLKGFDLVGEEDGGRSHMYFLANLLGLYNADTEQSRIPLVHHTGETSYPRDLIPSDLEDDPVATAQNAYEAILLGSQRLGHGLAYIKFPYLLNEIKHSHTAIESCPVSNQLLGLQADVRNHPAPSYMKMGIPVILGSDDPGTFGVDSLTLDWYEAFMAWGLTLKDLKKLANDSITYSLMKENEKSAAIKDKWTPKWDSYIQATKQEACSADLQKEIPEFYRILPAEGAITGSTNVHLFGRHFEWGLCGNLRCFFDNVESPMVHYVDSNHIICISPEGTGNEESKTVLVTFNDGSSFHDTNQKFTYKYQPINTQPTTKAPTTATTTSPPDGSGAGALTGSILVLSSLLLLGASSLS